MDFLRELFPAAIVSALVAAIVALLNNRRSLQDSLDSKSGWRKELFKVASKTFLTTDDIYLILAALRYQPKVEWKKDEEKMPKDFQEMTAYMYHTLNDMLKNYLYDYTKVSTDKIEESIKVLNNKDTDTVRLLAKYLLKHHWEDLGNGYFGRLEFKIMKEDEIIEEVFKIVEKNKQR